MQSKVIETRNMTFDTAITSKDKPIDQGAFGYIYLKKHPTGLLYVVKKLKNLKDLKESFLKELNNQPASQHPNVIICYGGTYDEDLPLNSFLIFEYANQRNLSQYLEEKSSWCERNYAPYVWSLEILLGIAHGLDHIHQQNIVHCDIKLENILLHNGVPKICDFGFSKMINPHTQVIRTTYACGSPSYAAPEIYQYNTYSPKSDVFAFGIVTHTLATFHVHFDDFTNKQIEEYICKGIRETFPEHVGEQARILITQSWKQNPNKRFTVKEIIEFIENELARIATPLAPTEQTSRPSIQAGLRFTHFGKNLPQRSEEAEPNHQAVANQTTITPAPK